jgi:hypothetical protein
MIAGTDTHATIEEMWKWFFPCGASLDYIKKASCHYRGVLRQQLKE